MTNSINNIKTQVKSYINKAVHVEKDKIHNDSLIFKEGYFDSMGLVMLISFIEESFNIDIKDEDLVEENFESINAISDFISRKTRN
ncbi:MAG: acyl carrier protein [Bacteroidota bacterium]|nr:acyl carrier protein [Bacteroidota bacterium]